MADTITHKAGYPVDMGFDGTTSYPSGATTGEYGRLDGRDALHLDVGSDGSGKNATTIAGGQGDGGVFLPDYVPDKVTAIEDGHLNGGNGMVVGSIGHKNDHDGATRVTKARPRVQDVLSDVYNPYHDYDSASSESPERKMYSNPGTRHLGVLEVRPISKLIAPSLNLSFKRIHH